MSLTSLAAAIRVRAWRLIAAAVLAGFTGSVIGLVYGWPPILDRIWFALCLVVAGAIGSVGICFWLQAGISSLPAETADSQSPTLGRAQPAPGPPSPAMSEPQAPMPNPTSKAAETASAQTH